MTSKTNEQEVKLFSDEETTGKQEVHYTKEDDWLVVNHDGYEMSLRLENFRKLNKLVEDTVKE